MIEPQTNQTQLIIAPVSKLCPICFSLQMAYIITNSAFSTIADIKYITPENIDVTAEPERINWKTCNTCGCTRAPKYKISFRLSPEQERAAQILNYEQRQQEQKQRWNRNRRHQEQIKKANAKQTAKNKNLNAANMEKNIKAFIKAKGKDEVTT